MNRAHSTHVLGYFFYGGMNMTHLESRPLEGKPFEYFFHIDVMGSLKDPSNTRTLEGLFFHVQFILKFWETTNRAADDRSKKCGMKDNRKADIRRPMYDADLLLV